MSSSCRRVTRRVLLAIAALTLVTAVAACGSSASKSSGAKASSGSVRLQKPTQVKLLLDFVPSAVHEGIYRGIAAGYYKKNNINLKILQPTSAGDVLRFVSAGKVDFGIMDPVDLETQVAKGVDYRAFYAVVQRPLGGIATLKKNDITNPKQLEGKKVGTTGAPVNKAFLDAMMTGSGGDPNKVSLITVGFDFAKSLAGGKIAAFSGYSTDAAQAGVEGPATSFLPLDHFGGPTYPSLVIVGDGKRLKADKALTRAFVDATRRGYEDAARNPEQALGDVLQLNPAIKRKELEAQLGVVRSLFQVPGRGVGEINLDDLTRLSRFLNKYKLIAKPLTGGQVATNDFFGGG